MSYWKILVYKEHNTLKAIGFLMSQKLAFEQYSKMLIEHGKLLKEDKIPSSLDPDDMDDIWNRKNLKRYQVKISLIESKTGLNFGLNDHDVNKQKDELFFIDVDQDTPHISRLKYLMEYNQFIKKQEKFDDLEFIKSL